jgi:hypothetical protein
VTVVSETIPNETWLSRPCPNCLTPVQGKAEVTSSKPAEFMNFEEVRDYFIGIRDEQVFFSYYRCTKCQTLYCPYYFSESQLDILYAAMPDNLLGAEKSTATRTQIGYVDWFQSHLREVGIYQELGPDIGLVTKEIVQRFKPSSILLVEPNLEMHDELAKLGSNTSKIELFRHLNEVVDSKVDLTIGIHVFDHLLNPSDQIKRICSQTNEGGFIGIVVHNEASILRRILGKKWPPFCLQHPQLFNRNTLEHLLSNNGFEKCGIARSTNHFSIQHIGSMAIDVIGLPKILKKFLPNIEIPFTLGNQISIFKKRG